METPCRHGAINLAPAIGHRRGALILPAGAAAREHSGGTLVAGGPVCHSRRMNESDDQRHYTFDASGALLATDLPLPRRSGKVRDVYDLGESLLIVSTDRISAFDWILPVGIPDKGRLLTAISQYWFERLPVRHHLKSVEVPRELASRLDTAPLQGRVMVTEKATVVPFECVVRGYLEGSGLREYTASGRVCGIDLPGGLRQCDRLPEPIFTPATKAEEGHDENVSMQRMIDELGPSLAEQLQEQSLELYRLAADAAAARGLLIADTKFEFGHVGDQLTLIDEVLTPDSSRFWAADDYEPGHAQRSFDKQFVREWLSNCDWDKQSPPPALPEDVIAQTAAKYREAYQRITGERFDASEAS